MEKIAVILAGGIGSRFEGDTPKQFVKIDGKEMILYSLETFSRNQNIDKILIISNKNYIEKCKNLIALNNLSKVIDVIGGGETRQESVRKAIEFLSDFDESIILVHDAARPYVSDRIINENVEAVIKYGSATTAIESTDSVYESVSDVVDNNLDRKTIYLAQTPQSSYLSKFRKAFDYVKITYTDESGLLSSIGEKPFIVKGDKTNIKITTNEDLK